MEHLMNELVGRSIARERERDTTASIRLREVEEQRVSSRPRRPGPPRHRRRTAPVAVHA